MTEGFHGFPQSLKITAEILPAIRPTEFFSQFLFQQLYYSTMLLLSELLGPSLNKPVYVCLLDFNKLYFKLIKIVYVAFNTPCCCSNMRLFPFACSPYSLPLHS
jgi:hypothetical protein